MIKLGLYQHYKGAYYQVTGIARCEATHKALVIYQAMHSDFGIWAREINDFKSNVMMDGIEMPRFKFIKEILTTLPNLN